MDALVAGYEEESTLMDGGARAPVLGRRATATGEEPEDAFRGIGNPGEAGSGRRPSATSSLGSVDGLASVSKPFPPTIDP